VAPLPKIMATYDHSCPWHPKKSREHSSSRWW
jgi:hypothetical protein